MSHDEQKAYWAAILAAPEDDAPRLAYADWLAEHEDADRAELIRVQCALAQLGPDRRKGRKERALLEPREQALLAAHTDRWLAPFRATLPGNRLGFRRGFASGEPPFPLYLGLEPARRLAVTGDTLEPVDQLHIMDSMVNYNPESVDEIARWTGAGSILRFSIAGGADRDIDALVRFPYLRNLRYLGVWAGQVTDTSIAQLAAWPFATTLEMLDLKQNPIGDAGAFALADSPYLGQLRRLDLYDTPIGPTGQERLRARFGDAVAM